MNEISQKQLEANRENAKLGGVKTIEGKEISKMNSIKHGLLSSQVLIKDEDGDELKILGDNLINQLNPSNQLEALLVDRVIAGFWRLRRIIKIESKLMCLKSYDVANEIADTINYQEKEGLEAKNTSNMLDNILLERVMRYENNIERGIFKAVHELQRIQGINWNERL